MIEGPEEDHPLTWSIAPMATAPTSPLSSTVSSVFDQFLKELEKAKVLNEAAQQALAQSLHDQKLDHMTLRKAIFTSDGPPE